jgi:hypothetical protein
VLEVSLELDVDVVGAAEVDVVVEVVDVVVVAVNEVIVAVAVHDVLVVVVIVVYVDVVVIGVALVVFVELDVVVVVAVVVDVVVEVVGVVAVPVHVIAAAVEVGYRCWWPGGRLIRQSCWCRSSKTPVRGNGRHGIPAQVLVAVVAVEVANFVFPFFCLTPHAPEVSQPMWSRWTYAFQVHLSDPDRFFEFVYRDLPPICVFPEHQQAPHSEPSAPVSSDGPTSLPDPPARGFVRRGGQRCRHCILCCVSVLSTILLLGSVEKQVEGWASASSTTWKPRRRKCGCRSW